ncbi:MAG: DVU0298 family protein [Desulfomonilaceae bacterium]
MPDASGGRNLKRMIQDVLRSKRLDDCVEKLITLPGRQVINPLISLLLNKDPIVRWRSVMVIGEVLSSLALHDLEGARIIMRRFMWSLNDESGGIGWGAPESMCVTISKSEILGREYGSIVISYLDPDGNFLEYEPLQRGLLWGICYLAKARPDLVVNAKPHLEKYLESADSYVRGLAVIAVNLLEMRESLDKLLTLVSDKNEFLIYEDDSFRALTVGASAVEAIKNLKLN